MVQRENRNGCRLREQRRDDLEALQGGHQKTIGIDLGEDWISVDWISANDIVLNMEADIIVPGQGGANMFGVGYPGDSRQKLINFRQVLVDARDSIQREIARGITEDEVVANVLLSDYQDLGGYNRQREVVVRRTYLDLKGMLE